EIVVPYAAKQLRAIANQITKKERRVTFKEGTVYMRGRDGSVMRVGLYLPDREAYQDVTIFRFNADGLRERIDAKSANWGKDERWHFNDVRTLDLKAGKLTKTPELALSGIDSPRIFQEEAWKVEELSVMELNSYKNRLQDAGFKNIKLLVDISSRVAYPIINLFMLLLGISLSVGSDQHLLQRIYQLRAFQNVESHGGVVSAGIGLLISLIYWFGYSFFLSLGYAGTLPPAVSPWIVPVAFSLLTAHLFRNIPE
ncbi:MAG TPA: LptF/LptG family permease, partial [Dissulfurispiraceae bacterium]|nr:LptF/LptG family permease [Dissulfurispiraceae bacterium]